MGECFWRCEEFLGGVLGGRSGAAGTGSFWGYVYVGVGGGKVFDGVSDEGVAIFVEGLDEGLDLEL